MKFIVFYLQLINSCEGLGMFFSSAFLTRRLRKYTATTTFKQNKCIATFLIKALFVTALIAINQIN